MKGHIGVSALSAVGVAVVILILLAPNVSSYWSTANPPPRGWRAQVLGSANLDASASCTQVNNNQAIMNIQTFTGGPVNNPEHIDVPPAGCTWVWWIEYSLTAQLQNPPNWVTKSEAAVEAELWLFSGGQWNWICTEREREVADASNPLVQDSGWLYLYDNDRNFQQGEIYHLFIYVQGRFFDINYNQWNTTSSQFVDLYYNI